jgi:enoyl-CoA hydratase/carnithine racemase
VGKPKALEMFIAAEKVHARDALRCGLIDAVAEDPVAESVRRIKFTVKYAQPKE